jgi:hypothetical protein
MGVRAYWKFNGNTNDSGPLGIIGTATDLSFSADNGKFGQGAAFNGSTSKLTLFSESISPLGSRTLSVWFKTNSTARQGIAGNRTQSAQNDGWVMTINLGGSANGLSYFHAGKSAVYSGVTLTTGKWYYGTVTYDYVNQVAKIFLNGELKRSQSLLRENISPINGQIGYEQEYSVTEMFNGYLDELRHEDICQSIAGVKNKYASYKGFY